jgi:hypothetical protein
MFNPTGGRPLAIRRQEWTFTLFTHGAIRRPFRLSSSIGLEIRVLGLVVGKDLGGYVLRWLPRFPSVPLRNPISYSDPTRRRALLSSKEVPQSKIHNPILIDRPVALTRISAYVLG